MASIYRFKRNSKKEDTDHRERQSEEENRQHFFPLLFGEDSNSNTEQKTKDLDGVPEIQEEPESPSIDNTATVEETPEATEEKSDTRAFSLSDLAAEDSRADHSETNPIPEELMEALETTEVDSKKLDEVFNHTKGSFSANTSQSEYDQTTALLLEVFGSDKKKKKKKKEAEPKFTVPASIQNTQSSSKEQELSAETVHVPQEETLVPARKGDGEYVAIHDAPDEVTKRYHATFAIEEALSQITPDQITDSIPELADEMHMPDQSDPYNDTYDEMEESPRKKGLLPEEFTAQEEYDEFAEHLRNRNFKGMISCVWSFLVFLALLYLESATFSNIYHPEFLKPDSVYSAIYLLIDIQLIFVASLLSLSSLGEGARGLIHGKPNRKTVPFLLTLLTAIHSVTMLILGEKTYPLFGCVAALFLFMTEVANLLDYRRIYRTFRVCGRQGDKLVASPTDSDSAEAEAFRDQLVGEPSFFSVHKASFIDGFFRRSNQTGKRESSFTVVLILSLLLSTGFAAYSYWKEPDIALMANRFMTMAMMTLPLSGVFTVALPFSHLSKKAEKRGCAIVSAADADRYAAADVVSFTDREIFPPKSVKVTTIRTYGQTRIDKAILYSAMVFQKLGGPLSHVFKKIISGVCAEISEDFDFLEITADGMCAKIDGQDIFLGNKDYLLSYDFGYTKDDIDDAFEEKSGKIMYMVINSELAAKFYIRYSISKRFKKTIFSLYKAGICPAVKTCDPNIDSDLFRSLLQNDKIPAGIIKTCEAMKDAPVAERSESGLVCNSTIANLLHSFTLCDSLKHLTFVNVLMKLISLLLGAGIVVFLTFIGELGKISALFVLIYQLLWMIPVIIPSLSE